MILLGGKKVIIYLKQEKEDTSSQLNPHWGPMGSCDELHAGVQDLKAVQLSQFVHMSEIKETIRESLKRTQYYTRIKHLHYYYYWMRNCINICLYECM